MKKLFISLLTGLTMISLVSCNKDDNSSSTNSSSLQNTNDFTSSKYTPSEDNKVHLLILAGQSGGRGKALVKDLEDEQKGANKDVDIIADGLIMEALNNIPETINDSLYFDELEPGYGDFKTEFGPELGIGETLASRYQKGDNEYKSIIVKYTACGSTFLDHWYSKSLFNDDELSSYLNIDQSRVTKDGDDTGPLTNNLYQLIDYTIEQLEIEGYEVVIDGASFVHGEQDAKYDENMEIYEQALKYFIEDLREYVGYDDLPFIITEALTNSAKYSNELRDIQRRVADSMNNTSLVETYDLYTNRFEPWHFGAQSNMILGNRIAAEIISLNDTRKVKTINQEVIDVPYGVKVELPKYVKASFTNNYSGYLKVDKYTSLYNELTLGEQDVKFIARTGEGIIEKSFKVNVSNNVSYIDGRLNEYNNVKKNNLPNNLGNVYIRKGDNGLFIASEINDSEIWTDGESWSTGDMGQKGLNDDFRIYVTTSTSENRKTICLSSANLLRIYDEGISLNDNDFTLFQNNLYFKNELNDFAYHVTTKDMVNDSSINSIGLLLELYISYEDLEIEDPDSIKLCFNYNNVANNNGTRTFSDNYLVASNGNEENDSSYFSINDLI